MNDQPPTNGPQLIRKTAYGRTELFLPTPTTIFREVKCMGGVQRLENACVYHMLPFRTRFKECDMLALL